MLLSGTACRTNGIEAAFGALNVQAKVGRYFTRFTCLKRMPVGELRRAFSSSA